MAPRLGVEVAIDAAPARRHPHPPADLPSDGIATTSTTRAIADHALELRDLGVKLLCGLPARSAG